MARREAPLDPARGSGVRRPPDTKKDRECRGLGLRRWPAQRRGNGSAESAPCQQNVKNMRAILSVSDKSGSGAARPRPGRPGGRTGLHRRHRQGAAKPRTAGRQRLRRHRLSRDDGRPGQDAAPGDPRRHPGPPAPARRPRGAGRPRHHAGRSRRRQPLSVRQGRRQPRHAVRRTWSRRSTSAARACSAPRPRTSATCWSSSIPPTTRVCSTSCAATAARRSRSASS